MRIFLLGLVLAFVSTLASASFPASTGLLYRGTNTHWITVSTGQPTALDACMQGRFYYQSHAEWEWALRGTVTTTVQPTVYSCYSKEPHKTWAQYKAVFNVSSYSALTCPSGSTISGSTCTCSSGFDEVGSSCLPQCTGGKTRVNGVCACPAGHTEVSGQCFDGVCSLR